MKAAHELRGRPGGPVRPPLHPLDVRQREEALSNYKKSAQEKLKTSGPRERSGAWYTENNLIGTPEGVAEFLLGFRNAGVTHGVPLHIAADTLSELRDQLRLFAEEVMPLVRAG